MTAVAWTAIGLLGTTLFGLFGAILQLGGRLDGLGRSLTAKIEEQGRDLGRRIDVLSSWVDAQSLRIDSHLERHA
jgi:hypothetical protein